MALFHFHVTQIKRSAGQSAIASAAYRSGEKLFSEYYGEYSDYTKKGGVVCSDLLLPAHVPPQYKDRQTLWNALEKAERGKKAQLAYSFDIALQNELSLEENIALARQFLEKEFVSRGMVVDFAVHQPDKEKDGIPNPHFHVLCPIRPILPDGTWGNKQKRVYELDEFGNRKKNEKGQDIFNAVPTTDWGSPDTLEHWRKSWADLCNAKFEEKNLSCRIDHRSYERQGIELLPYVHEGPTVQAMERKGIRTEKGEFNRWIKATNALIRELRNKITSLIGWLKEVKAELDKPREHDLIALLNRYYSYRSHNAYSQKGVIHNLKEMNETYQYLNENQLFTLEDLEHRVESQQSTVESLKQKLDRQTDRMKELRRLNSDLDTYERLKPVYDKLQTFKFKRSREKFKEEHEGDLRLFYIVRRRLKEEFKEDKPDRKKIVTEYARLEAAHEKTYARFQPIREEFQRLWRIRSNLRSALQLEELTPEQKLQKLAEKRKGKTDPSL